MDEKLELLRKIDSDDSNYIIKVCEAVKQRKMAYETEKAHTEIMLNQQVEQM